MRARPILQWVNDHLLLSLLFLFATYLMCGYLSPDFTRDSDTLRAARIDRDSGDVQIACLWNSHGQSNSLNPPSSFLLGARLAVKEINQRPTPHGGTGLLLPLPDRTLTARHLRLHELDSGVYSERGGTCAAANALASRRDLVAVVNNLVDPQAQQAAVVFESAGILNIETGGPNLGLSAPLLYTTSLCPDFLAQAYELTRKLLSAMSRSGTPVRAIGVLFNQRPPYNELAVQMLLMQREEANQAARVVSTLRQLVDLGSIPPDTLIADVPRLYGVNLPPRRLADLRNLLTRYQTNPRINTITVREVLAEFEHVVLNVDVPFVRSYSPLTDNFRDLLSAFQGTGADVLYILDDPVASTKIIRQFRGMGAHTPVVLVTLTDADRIVSDLGGLSDDIYSVMPFDPNRTNASLDGFRKAYRAFMRDSNLPPTEPDGNARLGYESIYLLAQCFERTRSTRPSVLAGAFSHASLPWQGKFFEQIKFNKFGQAINIPLYPVRLLGGHVVPVEEQKVTAEK